MLHPIQKLHNITGEAQMQARTYTRQIAYLALRRIRHLQRSKHLLSALQTHLQTRFIHSLCKLRKVTDNALAILKSTSGRPSAH